MLIPVPVWTQVTQQRYERGYAEPGQHGCESHSLEVAEGRSCGQIQQGHGDSREAEGSVSRVPGALVGDRPGQAQPRVTVEGQAGGYDAGEYHNCGNDTRCEPFFTLCARHEYAAGGEQGHDQHAGEHRRVKNRGHLDSAQAAGWDGAREQCQAAPEREQGGGQAQRDERERQQRSVHGQGEDQGQEAQRDYSAAPP